ncbi:MAG: bifunctional UDP-N-acetylmuramoyl-tripeptide:D-alanyl-D-alanine ligase/alanine racemase [Bacteroidota bacterium]|nr:bifunctional UDP-N-acetylmuramoyl-tripeptide:D-alanyl-D-alanine ligase/alanine racemase [Bacteroidota bacterium]
MEPVYTSPRVADIVHGILFHERDTEKPVRELLIDSRRLLDPEETLFIALVTPRNDGHRYIEELYNKGVKCFVVSRLPVPEKRKDPIKADFILVPDTMKALQDLAAYHRSQFIYPVIGITGSNGKTIIKEWLFQLLGKDLKIVRNPKSYNSQIGVPLSIWNMNSSYDLGIFEAGISQTGEMSRLETVIHPTIGLFTNIGSAHDEGFPDQKVKIREKLDLFRNCDSIVYCKDHLPIHEAILQSDFLKHKKTLTWGRTKDADLVIREIQKNISDSRIFAFYGEKDFSLTVPFTDDASIENAIHCLALMLILKYEPEVIVQRFLKLVPVAMRLELKEGINRCSVINDFYNSDITSLMIALDFLNLQKQHPKKTLILSDILQTGRKPENLYEEIAGIIISKGIDRFIGIGKEISSQADKFPMEKAFFSTTEEFLEHFKQTGFRDETILLKGARVFEFEKISRLLQQRVHETVLEVNMESLVHNLNYYRSKLKPETKTMVMVKAFSYGSGSYEIASLLQFHRVDYLAVAYADEGVELRKAGITLPIMVLNPEQESYDLLLSNNLEPEIYNLRVLGFLEDAISRNHHDPLDPMKIHIKLDTGMHRLGFMPGQLDDLIERLKENPSIRVQSAFSHLAGSEDPAEDYFTLEQIRVFESMSSQLRNALGYPFLRHILNSAGITRFTQAQMDMVRVGIGIYGIGFDEEEQSKLKNVSTLRSVISQIKKVNAGETIGYNRKGIADTDKRIALIPIGYADGLHRRLGNGRGRVFIHGKPAPLIGNISMDNCAADITEIWNDPSGTPVREGDEVIVFGDFYPLTRLAEDLETIPYEVLTGISRRVKRVYFQE